MKFFSQWWKLVVQFPKRISITFPVVVMFLIYLGLDYLAACMFYVESLGYRVVEETDRMWAFGLLVASIGLFTALVREAMIYGHYKFDANEAENQAYQSSEWNWIYALSLLIAFCFSMMLFISTPPGLIFLGVIGGILLLYFPYRTEKFVTKFGLDYANDMKA